jgi:hypothetical protein
MWRLFTFKIGILGGVARSLRHISYNATFTGVMMTAEFHEFLKEQNSMDESDVSVKEVAALAG